MMHVPPPTPGEVASPADSILSRHPIPAPRPPWLWLLIVLSAGIGLYLLSRINYPLFHITIEMFSVVLAAAVFTIGWNTRKLVASAFFLILATGFLSAGIVDFLHTLTYRGIAVLSVSGSNLSTQLWMVARFLETATFILAFCQLGRRRLFSDWVWVAGFGGVALSLLITVWPLRIFPVCFDETSGLTPFKVIGEYLIAVTLAVAAAILWRRWDFLSPRLAGLLLAALLSNIASELSFTFYADPYAFANFVGHLFKGLTVILVYHALVEGTLRTPYETLFLEQVQLNRDLDSELGRRRTTEEQLRSANQQAALLYTTTRILHSTLHLDTLVHLVLSMAVSGHGGGCRRAILFTANERTGVLQGMLGIDHSTNSGEVPIGDEEVFWENLRADESARVRQRETEFNRQVVKLRLPLQEDDNAVARASLSQSLIVVADPAEFPGGRAMAAELGLAGYACAPLGGRDHSFGVLLVEFDGKQHPTPDQLRFIELFSGQAAAALENARLLHRLEGAHRELRGVQEQLIQGEKMAVLGEMAAQVAHELKNPLVSVGGFAQRLTRLDLNDSRAREYAEIIAREVRRLEDMLGNILAFSKKQLICLEDCDLNQVLYEALSLEIEPQQRAGIELLTEIEVPLPAVVGDCRQLRQVVLNLLSNARQALPNGGRVILRSGACILRGEEGVTIEVEDTGGGIPSEIMRNIFNPFFSTHPKGTGLGLSISHRIIEQHQGEIEVFNGERGACFIIRIPLRPPGHAVR